MMRAIVTLYDQAKKALSESTGKHKITMNTIKKEVSSQILDVIRLKFQVKFLFAIVSCRIRN